MVPFSFRDESGIRVIVLEDPDGLGGVRDPSIRETIYGLIPVEPNARIVLDLSKADYLSSAGIAILIGLKRRIEPNAGQLRLCAVHPVVRELLSIMRLDSMFLFDDDLSSALSSFRSLPSD